MTTQLPNGYEAVKVPEGGYCYRISGDFLRWMRIWGSERFLLPRGEYTFISTADSISEYDARLIVEELPVGERWKNYLSDYPIWFYTALESFRSLLSSLHLEPHTTIIIKKENV